MKSLSEVFVLDASVVLATILNEKGGDKVADVMQRSLLSSVNLSEVVARLLDLGFSEGDIEKVVSETGVTTVPFDEALAIAAGRLRAATRSRGLSRGDRACLALGRHLGATVLTADRAWADLDVGVAIELIR